MAMKFTSLFLNLAKIHIFIPKSAYGGEGGSAGLGIIPKKNSFFSASLSRIFCSWIFDLTTMCSQISIAVIDKERLQLGKPLICNFV